MSCCAVIVTFYPDSEISENIAALYTQVDEIFIVDNGSNNKCKNMLHTLSKQFGVTIIDNKENIGIAAALNIGVKIAKAHNHEWVITFDQDSKAASGMVETMLNGYVAYPHKEKIASLSPRYMNKNTGEICGSRRLNGKLDKNSPYAQVDIVITSGNFIKLSVFDDVGYFNESLFIDYVDKEFCLRCGTQNFIILEIKDAILLHTVGLPTRVKFLFYSSIYTTNHSHLRRYYIVRNSIYTYKNYFMKRTFWVLIDFYYLIGNLSKAILFEKQRKKRLVAVFFGFYDGIIGKLGKCTREH